MVADSSEGSVGGNANHVKDGAIDLAAGTLGGAAVVYTGQPLDTVKVKMQTFPALYRSWVSCTAETFRLDGIRGLYSGSVPALLANVAENAALFTAYGYCQKAVASACGRGSVQELSPVESALSGSLAAFFAAAVLCPTELVKCRLQTMRESHPDVRSTPLSISAEMLRTKGTRAFFVGMTPTLMREVPGYFCFFGAYEYSRNFLTPTGRTKDEIGHLRTAISGGVGGMALWTVIFPADVVKSRMQVAGGGRFSQIFFDILRKEGARRE